MINGETRTRLTDMSRKGRLKLNGWIHVGIRKRGMALAGLSSSRGKLLIEL